MLPELWPVILDMIQGDARASVRLIAAVAALYRAKRRDRFFWERLEFCLPHYSHYQCFRNINRHLGLQRRIMSWVFYCDSPCKGCRRSLFGQSTGTFPLKAKYCTKCWSSHLVGERELHYRGYYLRYYPGVNFCMLPLYNTNVCDRFYVRRKAMQCLAPLHPEIR